MSPKPPSPSTRERILVHLHENRTATVSALSRAWGLTPADLRYHFNALIEEGLVERAANDAQPTGRGRPTQAYRLASRSAPDNFPGLCGALLAALLANLSESEKEAALAALAGQISSGFTPPAALTQRFNQAVAFLNARAYHARWEASSRGPRLLLRNCPYAELLSQHPELCTLDRLLLERLLQLPQRQAARMNLVTGKPPACVFSE